MANKLYIIVRADHEPGFQMAQGIHAKDDFQDAFPELHSQWRSESNTISVLVAQDEKALEQLQMFAENHNICCCGFMEPDLNYSLTALCLEPSAESILKKLPSR